MSPLVYSSSDDEDVPLAQKKALLEGSSAKPAPAVKTEAPPARKGVGSPAQAPKPATQAPKATTASATKAAPKATAAPAAKAAAKPRAAAPKPEPSSGSPSKVVRVKKEYALPGQTRDTPEEGDPLRKFYTSLLEQRPESEMARKWCVMNGLLSAEDAQAYVNAVAARKGDSRPASRAGNGAKATPAKRAAPKSAAGAKKTTPKGAAAAKKGAAKATPKKSAKAAATKTVAAKRASPGGSGKKSAAVKKATPASKAKVKREASPDWDDDGSDDEIIPAKKTRVSYY